MEYGHVPVLAREVVEYLDCKPGDIVVDATVGGGGHAELILKAIGSSGKLVGLDKDETALEEAKRRLAQFQKAQLALVKADFRNVKQTLQSLGVPEVDAVLLDLGVSSPQLDRPERGFSYQREGPLDMRMDQANPLTAADVVNTYSKEDLTRILTEYGEERWASRIASFIVEARGRRRIETTAALVKVIKDAIPAAARRRGGHPARRTFQALRIEVNDELDALRAGLEGALECLKRKGRFVVISYHSLEDRTVKRFFKEQSLRGEGARLMTLTKKPVRPTPEETARNRRAESARLRAAQRI